jgi:hypothetical protein
MAVPLSATVLDSKLAQEAVDLLAGKNPESARDAGILTKVDIIAIKQYVKKALSLPGDLNQVEAYLLYKTVGIAGLEPVDIQGLFRRISLHASSWDGVENQMTQQGVHLGIAAQNILITGGEIVAVIDQMPILEKVRNTLGGWGSTELSGIKYTSDDGEIAVAVSEIIASMRGDILKQQSTTQLLVEKLTAFRTGLVGEEGKPDSGLQPLVYGKFQLMQRNNFIKSIAEDQAAITEKKARIVQLDNDYDQYVKYAISGIAGGLIGLAITGGIFGDKAEKAKNERNALKEEVKTLEGRVKDRQNLQAALENLSLDFTDMNIRMLGAEQALNLLKLAWDTILANINESASQFETINDAQKLTSFVISFKKVIAPWEAVKDRSGDLVKVLNEALEEYKKFYN